jgi:polyisoprenoid-binding protein YceI
MLFATPIVLAAMFAAQPPAAPAAEPVKPAPAQPSSTPSASSTPARAASGKSVVIPEDQKKLGTAYHTVSIANQKQITFTSKAHNAEFSGHSAGVLGYAIAGPADNPADLKGGAWLLPLRSLDTGNKTKNRNLRQPEWLDEKTSPDIVFTLKAVKDITPHKAGGTGKSFKVTLVGDLTMRGVTKEVTIPETILGFVPGSDRTAKVAKGDLLAIRCKYKVKLTDFGVTNDYVLKDKSVADEIEIDQSLSLATVPPEEQPAQPAAPTPAKEGEEKGEPKDAEKK